MSESEESSAVPADGPTRISKMGSRGGNDRRHTLYYNAANYESLQKQLSTYKVVLLGTEYIESKKIGAKPFTVCISIFFFSFRMLLTFFFRLIDFVCLILMELNG